MENTRNEEEQRTNLIVNYLPQTMSQKDVYDLFLSIGPIESCKLVRDKSTGQSFGYAFVKFCKPELAAKAIDLLDNLRLQNKILKVSYARPNCENIRGANLYVKNLPRHTSQADLEKLFSPYGKIVSTRLIYDRVTGLPKRLGFVRFNEKLEAEQAIAALDGTIPKGSDLTLLVKFANSTSKTKTSYTLFSPASTSRYPHGWSIFIYNLVPECTEKILWELFAPYGTVTSAKIARGMDNKSKGFGFVTMVHYHEAVVAIQSLNGCIMFNRPMQVSFQKNKTY